MPTYTCNYRLPSGGLGDVYKRQIDYRPAIAIKRDKLLLPVS